MKRLHFGCGKKILKGFINTDIQKSKGIISFNFDRFPYPFKNNTFDYILSENVLEHLKYPNKVINEFYRICKDKAIIKISVPYWKHDFAYNGIEHLHFFNKRAIEVLFKVDSSYLIKNKIRFKILSNKLIAVGWRKHLPNFMLNVMDKFFINTYSNIEAEIEVLK